MTPAKAAAAMRSRASAIFQDHARRLSKTEAQFIAEVDLFIDAINEAMDSLIDDIEREEDR